MIVYIQGDINRQFHMRRGLCEVVYDLHRPIYIVRQKYYGVTFTACGTLISSADIKIPVPGFVP